MTDVGVAWDRIEAWLEANHPEAFAGLRPGIEESDLEAAERKLGVALPEAYRASLLRHDAARDGAPSCRTWPYGQAAVPPAAEQTAPAGEVRPVDWAAVERKLGVPLPSAYKALCDTSGSTPLEGPDGQFELLAPQATTKASRFPQAALAEVKLLHAERKRQRKHPVDDPDDVPVPDYRPWRFFAPGQGGLLPWGRDGGLLFFFDVDPARDPDAWDLVGPDPDDAVAQPRVLGDDDVASLLSRLLGRPDEI